LPHEVPTATLIARSVQDAAALEQSRVPMWHGLAGVHGCPVEQARHSPSWQTSPEPHAAPLGRLSDAMHCALPVEQSTVPLRHGLFVSVQLVPSAHAAQTPSWHTEPSSHAVPLARTVCLSLHALTPPSEHTTCPSWQGFDGMHASPGTHRAGGVVLASLELESDVIDASDVDASVVIDASGGGSGEGQVAV
jgi:hypothetical protein